MSEEGREIVYRILQEVNGCKYLYRSILNGAIEACVDIYGMKRPKENNDEIIDEIFKALNSFDYTVV